MKPRLPLALLLSLVAPLALFAATPATFNVLDYGAVPDGLTSNTAAIARAVAAAHAAGGGTVVFPAGRYLTGSIELESNLTLDLEAGSELLYSGNPADSPIVRSRWEDTTAYTRAPLIHAEGKENIAIVGRGKLNGQGRLWWWRCGFGAYGADPARIALARSKRAAWDRLEARIQDGLPATPEAFGPVVDFLRPTLVEPDHCRNFQLIGVTLVESPFWMFHPLYTDNVEVRGVTFESDGPNTDGIDVDSCRDVRISDCFFETGDDCIVIKSGRDADGRRIHRPTEHVAIDNCVMYRGHGAIVIGSETSGDIRDIVATNIIARGTDRGVRIKSQRGRGAVVENVRCSNFVIQEPTAFGIEITTRYTRQPPEPVSERTPVFRNFSFSAITIVDAPQAVSVVGLEEKAVENLRFTDISATSRLGFLCELAQDVELHHVRVDASKGPAFAFTASRDLDLDDIGEHAPRASSPVVRLSHSDDVWLHGSRAAAGTGTFLQVDGPKPANLVVADNDLSQAAAPVK